MKNLCRKTWVIQPVNRNGFSMIELLIASMVLAAAGALLVSGLMAVNRSAGLSVERTLTTQVLASQLALLDDVVGEQTPQSGTVTVAPEQFAWALDIVDAATPLAPLKQVTLTVTHNDHQSQVVTDRQPPPAHP